MFRDKLEFEIFKFAISVQMLVLMVLFNPPPLPEKKKKKLKCFPSPLHNILYLHLNVLAKKKIE